MLMANTYTENDLLLYLYNEMSPEEAKSLELELTSNTNLQASLKNLKAGMAVMDKLEAEPSPTSIELILEYSQKSAEKLEEA
ncbi:MAG: hypothetical protein CFE21_06305 [Bacteroidetes bacterium B1(2017)]|nr:MAG: hypothetical protein CFE21_06305 [Bacteroidetes bacterium B1(2017)]